ncbi:MAG TPA: endonuclease/exonuclease/phosphatase family protein [Bacillota bacterium]|jgi:endonuclease/exonuclease/phosphatase family metal-dependent hydrolase|nr:endonuclease/exonuclease/phosphatase family protein [Bacillota bacterium]
MRRIIMVLGVIVIVLLAGFAGFLGFISITDYRPKDVIRVAVDNPQGEVIPVGREITITSFNTGYCGLDKHADFFMDGGTMSRAVSREQTSANIDRISSFLMGQDSDIYLLQEVDRKSRRSYGTDQYRRFCADLAGYNSSFATNYKVAWVPVPLADPHGNVYSGIATLSRYRVDGAARYSLPGEFTWPMRLFELDRCMMESRLPTGDGRQLVIANVHLSAFDKGGFIRTQQLAFLKEYAARELESGNYVVIGGDWNHLLSSDPEAKKAEYGESWPFWLQVLPDDFVIDGFRWAVDETTPSCRTLDKPYVPGENIEVNIDGFLVSPGVEVVHVHGHDLGFENSDHNPVTVCVRFGEEVPGQD